MMIFFCKIFMTRKTALFGNRRGYCVTIGRKSMASKGCCSPCWIPMQVRQKPNVAFSRKVQLLYLCISTRTNHFGASEKVLSEFVPNKSINPFE